jgi:hypothetical protein
VVGNDVEQCRGTRDRQYLLEDPEVVIRGDRVLHLRYRFRH